MLSNDIICTVNHYMKMDLFLLGLATIPFDNLPFAPTRGWAAISPIIFWAYCVFNMRLFVKAVT